MIKFCFKFVIVFFFLSSLQQLVLGQEKFWINFKDKNQHVDSVPVSSQTINNRKKDGLPIIQETDYPVDERYIKQIIHTGATIHFKSKWLNAVSSSMNKEQFSQISSFPFVASITPLNRQLKVQSLNYGKNPSFTSVLSQINAGAVMEEGLDGSNITIGIIDVGFFGAKINTSLKPLFSEELVLGFRDYLNAGNKNPFGNKQSFTNSHGTSVWQKIGGYDKTTDRHYGLATGANYYLARTDNTKYEFRGEEDFWIAAIEWMDSIGIKLVNTSLGYSLGYDDPNENYHPEDMDGKTTRISQAAQIAADEKGMLLVIAAGNEGHQPNWQIVSAPADAMGVLSVGATQLASCAKIRYSALGQEFVNYLKPNISCYSPNGTSFSAPIITGLAACLWQKNPSLSNFEIIEIIERSGNLYPYGNNYVGYGVPDSKRALKLAENLHHNFRRNKKIKSKIDEYILHINSTIEERIVLFHKKNKWHVLQQEEVIHEGNQLRVSRPDNCHFTTIALKDKVIEIVWPDE